MIVFHPGQPGVIWLKAMFKYFCRKEDVTVVWYPNNTAEAIGIRCKEAEYQYEYQEQRIKSMILDAIATDPHANRNKLAYMIVRDEVKKLYGGEEVDVQGG